MAISDVPRILESIGAPYALIGGHAVIIRGHIRPTFDYDFLTSDAAALDPSSWESLEGASVNVNKGDYDDQFRGVVHIKLPDGIDVDVIVAKWKWEGGVIDRAESMDVEGVTMPVPRVSDLILLKLAAGGGLDLQDIMNLIDVHGGDPLISEVEARLDEVRPDVRDTWTKLLASLDV
jgi:hypothetical protein